MRSRFSSRRDTLVNRPGVTELRHRCVAISDGQIGNEHLWLLTSLKGHNQSLCASWREHTPPPTKHCGPGHPSNFTESAEAARFTYHVEESQGQAGLPRARWGEAMGKIYRKDSTGAQGLVSSTRKSQEDTDPWSRTGARDRLSGCSMD